MSSRTVTDTTPSVWDPATGRIYTFLFPDAAGTPRSAYGNETVEELLAAGYISPEAVILPFVDAYARQESADHARYCTGPEPITPERFDELLNCLPPQRWHRDPFGESFRISEPVCGNLWTYCVRIGHRHFTLTESGSITHRELEHRCIKYAAKQNVI